MLWTLNQRISQALSEGLTGSVTDDRSGEMVSTRFVGIDVLRGLAVIAVILNHTPHYAHGGFRENPWFFPALLMDLGYLGVPLFVLISGFCIHRRAAIERSVSGTYSLNWVQFWARRFWRLYPPYLAAIVFSLFCARFLHDKSTVVFQSLVPDLLTHLFLVHNLTAQYPVGLGNGAFWSLGMEEQLYLLYLPLFFMIRGRSAAFAAGVAIAVAVLWKLATRVTPLATVESFWGLGAWGMWPLGYWMHWAMGAWAVDAWFRKSELPKGCSFLSVGASALAIGLALNSITLGFFESTSLAGNTVVSAWRRHVVGVSIVSDLLVVLVPVT